MEYKLTDAQWFAFISGMVAGQWFNSSTSNIEYQTIFEPIGVGGTPTTGLKIDKIPYTGQEEVTFPLTTHHVNIKYCGFNVILNIPSGLSFMGFAFGDFGENIVVTQEESKLYIQGFKENNNHIEKESLLCMLKFKILGTPTKSQLITFQNGNCQDFNSSMLLQYMKDIYWGISPMANIDGGLIVGGGSSVIGGLSGPTVQVPIGEESQVQYTEAPTKFYTQSGMVSYQNIDESWDNYSQDGELLGVIATNNYSRNFWLNLGDSVYSNSSISHVDFNFYAYSELVSYEVLHDPLNNQPYNYYTETIKVPEWVNCNPSLKYTYNVEEIESYTVPFKLYSNGNYATTETPVSVKHYSMTAYDILEAGTYSVGCFNLEYTQHKYILDDTISRASYIQEANDLIYGIATVYYTDGSSEDILLKSDYNAVSFNTYGAFESEESEPILNTEKIKEEIEKDDSLGYTELEGEIYSDSEQDIEIQVGDVIHRVHLKPGYNKVKIKVPSISYKKQVVIVKIKVIVSEGGYILFPLGFTIKRKQAKDELILLPFMSSMIETIFIRDKVSYHKISKEEVDLDFLLEKLFIYEHFNYERVEIERILINLLEYIKIFDASDLGTGGVAVDLDQLIEFLSINEAFKYVQFTTETTKNATSEGLGVKEVVIFEFE